MTPRALACVVLGLCGAVHAAEPSPDAEEAGLRLADETPELVAPPEASWRASLEPVLTWVDARPDGSTRAAQRLSLDVSLAHPLAPGWRLIAADRLDILGPDRLDGQGSSVNTLKELYVAGRLDQEHLIDVGRVNARFGVASGYNPTDHFRDHAVRSVTSVDPAALRENRLGTVMVRTQKVWSTGALTALVAPRLSDGPNDAGLAVDIGATNDRTRWLLAWSQRWSPDWQPQWLLYGEDRDGAQPQLGLNITRLLSEACVAHLEGSAGRRPSLLARARGRPGDDMAWRTSLATGLTCSNRFNQSLTLEFQHDGAALDRQGWNTLRAGPILDYVAYRQEAQARQDLPTRDHVFAMARWQNAFMPQLDLAGFARWNLADRSRMTWLEARYRWPGLDLAVQWQANAGGVSSEHGAVPARQVLQILVRYFF